MRNFVQWLISLEQMAAHFYEIAAEHFEADENLYNQLKTFEQEETVHFHMMQNALCYIQENDVRLDSEIIVDKATRERIETPFRENVARLEKGSYSRDELLTCIAQTEFTEWNQLFLFVLNSLKEIDRTFQFGASQIQSHLDATEHFLKKYEEGQRLIDKFFALPKIWTSRILIVDDSQPVRELLTAIFEGEHQVKCAADGREAFNLLKESFFDLVISDLDMPEMSGIQLYHNTIKMDKVFLNRFLIFSSSINQKLKDQFSPGEVVFINKPAEISTLRQAVTRRLDTLKHEISSL